jgi:hypothetical protein
MKLPRLVAFAAIISLVSCQKEISLDLGTTNPGGGGGGTGGGGGGTGSTGTLLKKIVTKDITDSLVENFGYDSQKKLIAYSVKGANVATGDRDERYTITRDAQARISQVKEISSEDGGITYDTITSNVFYTSGTAKTIAYYITVTNSTDRDSSVVTYTSGKISKVKTYQYNGTTYDVSDESVYTYSAGGNLTSVKSYDLSTGSTLILERNYTYDTKTTALNLGMEDGILVLEYYSGPNNFTKMDIIDHGLGLGNITLTYTLSYNSNNMPVTGALSATVMGVNLPIGITSTHQYQ